MDLTIHCDGGSRGNPGLAACAYIAYEGEREVASKGVFLGITTNNVAEYSALIHAFEWLKNLPQIGSVTFVLDSELVVKQMQGLYKVKSPLLLPLVIQIKAAERSLGVAVNYRHVLRSENSEADLLVNQTLDSVASK